MDWTLVSWAPITTHISPLNPLHPLHSFFIYLLHLDTESVMPRTMKSSLMFSALVCAALASSTFAAPTPVEPLFVSRMVKRDSVQDASSSCGNYVLSEPGKLQALSYNDSTSAYLSVSTSSTSQILTALPSSSGVQGAYDFDFQTCNYQGFTQGFSRNSGGSMGAPLEYWGRVTTNVTILDALEQKCLSALPSQDNQTQGEFELASCNDSDSKQWFRLQESLGGPVVTYFPVKNETGYVYTGQTPEYFSINLHPNDNDVNAVKYQAEYSEQYVMFD